MIGEEAQAVRSSTAAAKPYRVREFLGFYPNVDVGCRRHASQHTVLGNRETSGGTYLPTGLMVKIAARTD